MTFIRKYSYIKYLLNILTPRYQYDSQYIFFVRFKLKLLEHFIWLPIFIDNWHLVHTSVSKFDKQFPLLRETHKQTLTISDEKKNKVLFSSIISVFLSVVIKTENVKTSIRVFVQIRLEDLNPRWRISTNEKA